MTPEMMRQYASRDAHYQSSLYAYAQRSKNHARVIIQIPMLHTRFNFNKKWQSRDNLGILRFVYGEISRQFFNLCINR